MSSRNLFFSLLGLLLVAAAIYYFFSIDRSSDLVLIGTVDANQVVVSPKMSGRIERLAVEEGDEIKAGQTVAVLDARELTAEKHAAQALLASLRSQVAQTRASEKQTSGETTSGVVTAQARLQAAQANLAQAQADQQRISRDTRITADLARQGIASAQQADQAGAQLNAQDALVRSSQDQVKAAQSEVESAQARTHQTQAAQSTVAATQAQALSAGAQLEAAETRLGYMQLAAPINGIVTVRAAREGEVVNLGQPVVIITDLSETWVRAAIPETQATHIAIGDALKVRLPSGEIVPGKVTFKAPEAEFATQRDVSRRKRDIKAIVLKVAIDNRSKMLVPGMTAEVLIPRAQAEVR